MPTQSYPEPSSAGIKTWAEEDRPREKLLLKGKQTLSESELLAILIRTGTKNNSALEVAKKLLQKSNNDMNSLAKLSVKDILDLKLSGIGETKAITIVAALELGRRRQLSEAREKTKITSSREIFSHIYPFIADKDHEEFWI